MRPNYQQAHRRTGSDLSDAATTITDQGNGGPDRIDGCTEIRGQG